MVQCIHHIQACLIIFPLISYSWYRIANNCCFSCNCDSEETSSGSAAASTPVTLTVLTVPSEGAITKPLNLQTVRPVLKPNSATSDSLKIASIPEMVHSFPKVPARHDGKGKRRHRSGYFRPKKKNEKKKNVSCRRHKKRWERRRVRNNPMPSKTEPQPAR